MPRTKSTKSVSSHDEKIFDDFIYHARSGDDAYVISKLKDITVYGVLFAASFSDNLSESTKDMIKERMNNL